MVAVIDYDAGNIKSVEKAVQYLGYDITVTRDRDEILKSDRVILPGVGAFGAAMDRIRGYGLESVINEVVYKGTPFLGICLGLQLLFERSEEAPGVKGLSLLKGEILKIPTGEYVKIPHMGWNSLKLKNDGRLFKGVDDGAFVYFVHSYYLKADDDDIVKAETYYNTCIHASVEKDNVYACQFHPEKSSDVGLKMLKNFLE
ncbi:MAG: imidazole glycerol phosphate synthase subunit HisH [Lachnospiraceae bacterium]|nr:imidazole glycerol phosphate synthase subunit HisH [Lachnospiraceae bacterium]